MSLPPPWQVCFSKEGYKYYYNEKSMESVWELPADVAEAVADGVSALRNGGSWKLYCDAENHPFYFNATTNESRWAQPEDWERHNDAAGRPYFHNIITGDSVWAQEDEDDPDGDVKIQPKKPKSKSTWYRNLSDALADSRYGASAIETHDTAPTPHNGYASDFPTYDFMVTRKSKLKEHEIEVREAAKARRAKTGRHPTSPSHHTQRFEESSSSGDSGSSNDESGTDSEDGSEDVESGRRPQRGVRKQTAKVLRKLEKAGDGQPALMPLLVNWVLRVMKTALSATKSVSGKAVSVIGSAGATAAHTLADYSVVAASYIGEGMEHAAAVAGPALDAFIQRMDNVVGVSLAIVDSASVGTDGNDVENGPSASMSETREQRPLPTACVPPATIREAEMRTSTNDGLSSHPVITPVLPTETRSDEATQGSDGGLETAAECADGTLLVNEELAVPTSPVAPPPELLPPMTPVAPPPQPNLE